MIPLKIEKLLAGKVVEQNRVEYKEGWNPNDIIQSICAYANDYHNMNGGYLVIGVKANDGIPELPPKGLPVNELDAIQQEIFQYCNQIVPRYIPKMEVVNYQEKGIYLIYLWCTAGDSGPYQAPVDVYAKKAVDKRMQYWIRPASLTTAAKQDEIAELFEKFNSVPFDDRVNRKATMELIRRGYVEDYLKESNSSLVAELNADTLEELLIATEVANSTDTGVDIRNIGVLMFTERPDKLIPGAQIDLVRFNTEEAEASDDFIEKTFTGPIWKQVKDALDYIKNTVIEAKVNKIQNQAESERFYNYPYNAIEEALVNAVFHKSYKEPEPVEIRIYVDSIQIINYPGLEKWIDIEKFASGKVKARKYRNRRIGEMFKDIDLSEKQGTGIPKILRELKKNGSPEPEFDMDEERTYLNTIIHIRDGFEDNRKMSDKMSDKVSDKMSDKERAFYSLLLQTVEKTDYVTTKTMSEVSGMPESTTRRYLNKFCDLEIVKSDGKNKGTKYYLL
ncbi:MAG: putative DNA binding domain-containing protein [Roseburia sp.]|nr:putative DNA binding domain-containing protein [Roseburia sp.]